jgi:hypothetical protein
MLVSLTTLVSLQGSMNAQPTLVSTPQLLVAMNVSAMYVLDYATTLAT